LTSADSGKVAWGTAEHRTARRDQCQKTLATEMLTMEVTRLQQMKDHRQERLAAERPRGAIYLAEHTYFAKVARRALSSSLRLLSPCCFAVRFPRRGVSVAFSSTS